LQQQGFTLFDTQFITGIWRPLGVSKSARSLRDPLAQCLNESCRFWSHSTIDLDQLAQSITHTS